MSRSKNPKTVEVEMHGLAHKGAAVGRTDDGMVVFAEGTVPGDRAEILLTRKRKGVWNGYALQILRPSAQRTQPRCSHFGVCGGCSWQQLNYEEQIRQKEQLVKDAMLRIAKLNESDFEPILPAAEIWYYRNKLEYTFSAYKWLTREELGVEMDGGKGQALGFHRPGNFTKIVDIQSCHLQIPISDDIRNFVRSLAIEHGFEFYDIKNQSGYLRNLIVRTNQAGEVLLILSTRYDDPQRAAILKDQLVDRFPSIISIYLVVNPKSNDSLSDLPFHKLYGEDYLTERLDHVKFLIGPKSFFQTNSRQASALYQLVREYANLEGHETVYDWYCGVGSIGIYLASQAGQVVGVEEIEAAIEDARLNAAANQLDNCTFYASDAKDLSLDQFFEKHGKPGLIVVDPPRAGLHEKVVSQLLEMRAPKIVYVSCNPATQARDLLLLKQAYKIEKIRPVDMFPHTNHVESVALLSLL